MIRVFSNGLIFYKGIYNIICIHNSLFNSTTTNRKTYVISRALSRLHFRLPSDCAAPNYKVHMQDKDKCFHLQSLTTELPQFRLLNMYCIYSSSSIYGKWYCMKVTTCLETTKGVSLSFSRQKPALSALLSPPKVAHSCRFWGSVSGQ